MAETAVLFLLRNPVLRNCLRWCGVPLWLVLLSAHDAPLCAADKAASKAPPTFESDVRPILKAHCFTCHGEGEKLKGGLDVRLRHLIAKGGGEGPAIVPGKPEQSLLFKQVRDGEMPKGDRKLTPEQVALIGKWIAAGAKTEKEEPKEIAGYHITDAERKFWVFQPMKRPPVPASKAGERVSTPIDAFLLAKLRGQKLAFAPEADRATLIRRASFDLTGLPPAPEEVAEFLADKSPTAYERMLDRLLASPHYGERWGRHWLDVAGYADSDGYTEADVVRRYAWKYRDYVIRSLNADKPFDQFIREQLAGDELIPSPRKELSPDAIEKLTATGFLRMAPDGTASASSDQKLARNAAIADTLKIVSTSLLGLTVGCAQCHDHRYDPIPQTDYYRLRAIFQPALDSPGSRRLVPLLTSVEVAEGARIEAEAKQADAARLKRLDECLNEILDKELVKAPDDLRAKLREAYQTVVAKRTPAQVKLLKDYPTVASLTAGSLYLYNQKMADELLKLANAAAAVRAKKPFEDFLQPLAEPAAATNTLTFLFHRGDPDQPKQAVKPGDLTILASLRPVDFPEKDKSLPTTGRRLAFANSLTDGTHPLTARVLVNRVWMHHFGRGIVASAGDFGFLGERPTHPELLDWLASEFVAQGWSLKRLHKLIMTSTAYRQSAVRDPKKDKIDPDNRLLARMNVRRLEAEGLRDAMLAVSGKLNPKLGGTPVPIRPDEVGQIVVGVDTNDGAGRPTGKFVSLNGEEFRRSLYIQVRRTKPLGMLETFDLPQMEPNCDSRNASTVAPQSLALMNGEFTLAQAKFFAERVVSEAGDTLEAQVKRAWQLAFARTPSAVELKESLSFITAQTEHFVKQAKEKAATPATAAKSAPASKAATTAAKGKEQPPKEPVAQALATFCQALLTANRFLYVD